MYFLYKINEYKSTVKLQEKVIQKMQRLIESRLRRGVGGLHNESLIYEDDELEDSKSAGQESSKGVKDANSISNAEELKAFEDKYNVLKIKYEENVLELERAKLQVMRKEVLTRCIRLRF
jgi:hypothetical protein